MTKNQIDLIKINISILTAWIEGLQFRLRCAFVQDEQPLINEIANYKALIFNLESVLTMEKEKENAIR